MPRHDRDMPLDVFVESCVDLVVSDEPGPRRVLKNLRRIGLEQASADVRLATGFAAEQIRASDCGGWAVARVPERALVVPHDGQTEPEMIWHIARLLCAVANAPLDLDPVNYGVIYSSVVPPECWPAGGHDASIDDNARDLLLSMGVNEAAATMFWRPPCA